MSISSGRIHAKTIFDAAIHAVMPGPRVQQALQEPELNSAIKNARRIIVVGGGKAAVGMVEGVEAALADQWKSVTGIVNIPVSLWKPTKVIRLRQVRSIGVNEPTTATVAATCDILDLVATAREDDVVLVLLSGGASAMMALPARNVTLEDKIALTRQLSGAGATIQELNCVRKHLSRIKGGQLAKAAGRAASIWSLIVSDVIGNPLDVIASGPTAPDPTTYDDAITVINKYGLGNAVPTNVMSHLESGRDQQIPETPTLLPSNVHNRIIASNADALAAARHKARDLGYDVTYLADAISGNTADVARMVATYIPDDKVGRPLCILFGGETTVALGDSPGVGGRNQELTLAIASEIKMHQYACNRVTVLCAGTDGEDGPTDAAGAIWDADVMSASVKQTMDPSIYLRNHNSYRFFQKTGGLLKTGLTGTNVMDMAITLVESIADVTKTGLTGTNVMDVGVVLVDDAT